MARYIDLDKAIQDVESVGAYYSEGEQVKEQCLFELKEQPIADVVPRSEVEDIINYFEMHLQIKRKQVDVSFTSRDMRNYQCGAIDIIEYFEEWCAELKKKYIGEQ